MKNLAMYLFCLGVIGIASFQIGHYAGQALGKGVTAAALDATVKACTERVERLETGFCAYQKFHADNTARLNVQSWDLFSLSNRVNYLDGLFDSTFKRSYRNQDRIIRLEAGLVGVSNRLDKLEKASTLIIAPTNTIVPGSPEWTNFVNQCLVTAPLTADAKNLYNQPKENEQ